MDTRLIEASVDACTISAITKLKRENVDLDKIDLPRLTELIKERLLTDLPAAAKEAEAAYACGMHEVGAETYKASMVCSGIVVAKEYMSTDEDSRDAVAAAREWVGDN